jgi:hypothetical protein
MGRGGADCGASGRSSGRVDCWAERIGRPSKRAASTRAPLRTLLVISLFTTPRPLEIVSRMTGEAETATHV